MITYAAEHKSFDGTPLPTYEGAVLGFETKEERIMSDVYAMVRYALVWNGSKVERVAVSNSEFGASGITATVDATDEVKAHTFLYLSAIELRKLDNEFESRVNRMVELAKTPIVGKDVVVVKGRKVAHGTSGRVFWFGNNGFGDSVGIEQADGTRVFTSVKNVEVVNADDFIDLDYCVADKPDYTSLAYKLGAKEFYRIVGYMPTQQTAA